MPRQTMRSAADPPAVAPAPRQRLLYGGGARSLSLAAAVALMLLVTLMPRALTVEDGSPISHGILMLIMWGMSAGFVHGVGFVPRNAALRLLLGPWISWGLMAVGLGFFVRYFLR